MDVICPKCGFVDAGLFCSRCGSGLQRCHPAQKIAKVLAAPFFEYLQYSRSILRPEQLVDNIQAGRFDVYDLLSFLLASATISTVVEYFFPSEALFPDLIPIVGEAITALSMMAIAGLTNAPLHFYFNFKKKDVTFAKFLLASAAITALFFPWLGLISGVANSLGMKEVANSAGMGSIVLYMQTYSLLYRRSRGFVLGGIVIYMVAVISITLAVIVSIL